MRNGVGALLCALLFYPVLTHAQVVISEIMYAPQSGGVQWLEIGNEGTSDVTLIGSTVKGSWRLVVNGSNHTLTDPAGGAGRGSLVLSAGSRAVITEDPSGFVSQNGGAYSVIKSSLGLTTTSGTVAIFDGATAYPAVSYDKSQGAYKDGASLQLQPDGTWIAALPTPGEANAHSPYTTQPDSDTHASSGDTSPDTGSQENEQQTQRAAPTPYYIPPPVPQLFADAGADRTVIVGADIEFDGRAYTRDQVLLDKARYLWNFGDGSTAEGPAVLHHFDYPGRYAVILTAAADKESLEDEIIVTAEPAQLSFAVNADGSVTIDNGAGRDLDLSRWLIRSFGQVFALPEHSVILAGESMRIPQHTLQFIAGLQTELAYPNGVAALRANESSAPQTPAQNPPVPTSPIATNTAVSPQTRPATLIAVKTAEAADMPEAAASDTLPVQTAAAAAPTTSYWWLALAALIVLGAGALVYIRRIKSGEWDIEEA
jgi:hypothetical protein